MVSENRKLYNKMYYEKNKEKLNKMTVESRKARKSKVADEEPKKIEEKPKQKKIEENSKQKNIDLKNVVVSDSSKKKIDSILKPKNNDPTLSKIIPNDEYKPQNKTLKLMIKSIIDNMIAEPQKCEKPKIGKKIL